MAYFGAKSANFSQLPEDFVNLLSKKMVKIGEQNLDLNLTRQNLSLTQNFGMNLLQVTEKTSIKNH